MTLRLCQDEAADEVLSTSAFALLSGMLLDQQFPMERAFAGPAKLLDRLGTIDPRALADIPPEEFIAVCAQPPVVHRFPRSMGERLQALARIVTDTYGGDAAALWDTAQTGEELMERLQALPGFGRQKAQIFVALLGKQLAVRPPGWEQVAGPYAEPGSYRSIADVHDPASLNKVRAFKKDQKAQARVGREPATALSD